MHELGVVFHIAKQVEEIAIKNNVKKVRCVTLQVGEVSTIINTYLVDCWNWNAKKYEVLDGCELKVEMIKAVTFCRDCCEEYDTVKYGKKCPNCGSEDTYLLRGNEVIIKDIAVE